MMIFQINTERMDFNLFKGINDAGKTGLCRRENTNLDFYIMPYTKINFKYFTIFKIKRPH